jgi:uncharacterized membrane protein YoaK (UPF0700 family)
MSSERQRPSADSGWVRVLLFLLSVIAGTTDMIGFLGLNGLFTAHITGNLVLLCAHLAGSGDMRVSSLISIPVFAVVVCLTRILAGRLMLNHSVTLSLLLFLQLVCLAGFLLVCMSTGNHPNPDSTITIVAGMLGVSAMAVQNALAQTTIENAPSTAIMTTNVTRFSVDVGTILLGAEKEHVDHARSRSARTLPVILGFAGGCIVGALCEQNFGLMALALPTGLAVIALILGVFIERQQKFSVSE